MAEAIDLSLRHLSSEDIAALTRYLRTVPATTIGARRPDRSASGHVEWCHGLVAGTGSQRVSASGFRFGLRQLPRLGRQRSADRHMQNFSAHPR